MELINTLKQFLFVAERTDERAEIHVNLSSHIWSAICTGQKVLDIRRKSRVSKRAIGVNLSSHIWSGGHFSKLAIFYQYSAKAL
jgi:hypothetical protein